MDYNVIYNQSSEQMQQLPDNSIDAIVCDPPYGLVFMGKAWDSEDTVAFRAEYWKEVLRVAKPGAHLLAFGGTRTFHHLVNAVEEAGWVIRDCVAWIYGSGFPKSQNISRDIDKELGVERTVVGEKEFNLAMRGGNYGNVNRGKEMGMVKQTIATSDKAKEWDGWGTALKPAMELICMARKPLSEKTVAKNVLKHGTGAINVGGARIGSEPRVNQAHKPEPGGFEEGGKWSGSWRGTETPTEVVGRWPSNVTFSHNMDCEPIMVHEVPDNIDDEPACDVERYECTEGCPVAELEKQSGFSVSRPGTPDFKQIYKGNSLKPSKTVRTTASPYDDSGSAARFFFISKPSVGEKEKDIAPPEWREKKKDEPILDAGGHEIKQAHKVSDKQVFKVMPKRNFHTTVKPVDLMCHLIRLVTPPGGVVLDPFCGSGTTLVAAESMGFKWIGYELSKEYAGIAEARLTQRSLFNAV